MASSKLLILRSSYLYIYIYNILFNRLKFQPVEKSGLKGNQKEKLFVNRLKFQPAENHFNNILIQKTLFVNLQASTLNPNPKP